MRGAIPFDKMVYICSPYATGNVNENVENAQKYCRKAYEEGCLPIAPHLLFPQFMDDNDSTERVDALNMDMRLIERIDEMWVFGDEITSGMSIEMTTAQVLNVPIKRFKTNGEPIGTSDGYNKLYERFCHER